MSFFKPDNSDVELIIIYYNYHEHGRGVRTRYQSRRAPPPSPMLDGPAIDSQPPVATTAPHSPPYKSWMQIAAKHAGHVTTPIAATHVPTQACASQSLASLTSLQGFCLSDDESTDDEASQCSVILLSQRPPWWTLFAHPTTTAAAARDLRLLFLPTVTPPVDPLQMLRLGARSPISPLRLGHPTTPCPRPSRKLPPKLPSRWTIWTVNGRDYSDSFWPSRGNSVPKRTGDGHRRMPPYPLSKEFWLLHWPRCLTQ
jgi:hypothetical protein